MIKEKDAAIEHYQKGEEVPPHILELTPNDKFEEIGRIEFFQPVTVVFLERETVILKADPRLPVIAWHESIGASLIATNQSVSFWNRNEGMIQKSTPKAPVEWMKK